MELSAELRNRIYACLFEHRDPLYVFGDMEDGHVKSLALQRMVRDENEGLLPSRLALFTGTDSSHSPNTSVYQPGVAMFRVSRQIHFEAASIFYKNNTFAISRTLSSDSTLHDRFGHFIGPTLEAWFSAIGNHADLLRTLLIDLDTLCPASCCDPYAITPWSPTDESFINLGPLMCLLWSRAKPLSITFVSTKNESTQRIFPQHGNWHTLGHRPGLELDALNLLFNSVLEDELHIKQFRRAIHAIYAKRDASGGIVFYNKVIKTSSVAPRLDSTSRSTLPSSFTKQVVYHRPFTRSFRAERGMNPVIQEPSPPGFNDLPAFIQNRIIIFSFIPQEPQHIDMDDLACSLAKVGHRYVNRRWLTIYKDTVTKSRSSVFSIQIRSKYPDACIHDTEKLTGIVDYLAGCSKSYGRPLWAKRSGRFQVDIVLGFELQNATSMSLRDVCFDATPIVEATLRQDQAHIVVNILCSDDTSANSRLAINNIRYEILKAWPKEQEASNPINSFMHLISDTADRFQKTPHFWFNGMGKLVRVIPESHRLTYDPEYEISDNSPRPLKTFQLIPNLVRSGWHHRGKDAIPPSLHGSGAAYETYRYLQWISKQNGWNVLT